MEDTDSLAKETCVDSLAIRPDVWCFQCLYTITLCLPSFYQTHIRPEQVESIVMH